MATTAVTYNGAIPAQPQAINTLIEINSKSVLVDLTMQLAQGKIAGVQTIYVDLINHLGDVFITMPDTGQRICAKAQTQGYYPVLSTNLMKFEISSMVNGKFPIQFINFPIASGVWGFNLIKGDDGEKGEKGDAGSQYPVVNASGAGDEISLIENNEIKLKKLIAGNNITINSTNDNITINSTGGGGTGGSGNNSLAISMVGYNLEGTAPPRPAMDLSPLATGAWQAIQNFDPETFELTTQGIKILKAGYYNISFASQFINPTSGKYLIKLFNGEYATTLKEFNLYANENCEVNFFINATPDTVLNIGICNADVDMTSAIFMANIVKLFEDTDAPPIP